MESSWSEKEKVCWCDKSQVTGITSIEEKMPGYRISVIWEGGITSLSVTFGSSINVFYKGLTATTYRREGGWRGTKMQINHETVSVGF